MPCEADEALLMFQLQGDRKCLALPIIVRPPQKFH
jgi:hypothetical protein